MKREFLQLAKKYRPDKDNIAGYYVSEKLDGMRVFWDGGVTRGIPTPVVPWANIINPKTGEWKDKIKPVATGLWSRYGNPIMAPDWWLNQLPQVFLDGELFAGRGNFQKLRSIVAKDHPDEDAWFNVSFAVFGTPTASSIFQEGRINNPNFVLDVDPAAISKFLEVRRDAGVTLELDSQSANRTFEDELYTLQSMMDPQGVAYLHQHYKLPENRTEAEQRLNTFMDQVLDQGGEGIMLRRSDSLWIPKRANHLLKHKPYTDDAGTLMGFVSGRETNKGSKYLGMVGAMILDYKGQRLELSGFTDEERRFDTDEMTAFAGKNPGQEMPEWVKAKHFNLLDKIEFRYRELSDDGIPKEARYARRV